MVTGPETLLEDKGNEMCGAMRHSSTVIIKVNQKKNIISLVKTNLAKFVKIIYCIVWDGFLSNWNLGEFFCIL